MKKIFALLIMVVFVFGALAIVHAEDPVADACKTLKGKVDDALKAFDTAKAAFDKTCGKTDKLPMCGKLKKTVESAQKAKEDIEKQYKDQCGGAEE